MVSLGGIHFLLTYKCCYECDHCFLWSSPGSEGTMSLKQIDEVLRQADEIGTVKWIFFEGGEPFLFYPILAEGVRRARKRGYDVGIVSNAYWATDRDDAVEWLRPLAEQGVADLSLSKDEYHGREEVARNVGRAQKAARQLSVPAGVISIRGIDRYSRASRRPDEGELYFRGRAAVKLAPKINGRRWQTLDHCPEEPSESMRVHVDTYGNVQFCQGITLGNLWRKPLRKIMDELDLDRHPVVGPLRRGGPKALAMERGIRPKKRYADACHMCYELRCVLRKKGPLKKILVPDQAYGAGAENSSV